MNLKKLLLIISVTILWYTANSQNNYWFVQNGDTTHCKYLKHYNAKDGNTFIRAIDWTDNEWKTHTIKSPEKNNITAYSAGSYYHPLIVVSSAQSKSLITIHENEQSTGKISYFGSSTPESRIYLKIDGRDSTFFKFMTLKKALKKITPLNILECSEVKKCLQIEKIKTRSELIKSIKVYNYFCTPNKENWNNKLFLNNGKKVSFIYLLYPKKKIDGIYYFEYMDLNGEVHKVAFEDINKYTIGNQNTLYTKVDYKVHKNGDFFFYTSRIKGDISISSALGVDVFVGVDHYRPASSEVVFGDGSSISYNFVNNQLKLNEIISYMEKCSEFKALNIPKPKVKSGQRQKYLIEIENMIIRYNEICNKN